MKYKLFWHNLYLVSTQVALVVKNPPTSAGDIGSLGWEDPLEEGMATHSSILLRESHEQRSLVSYTSQCHRVGHDRSNLACMHIQLVP